MCRFAAERMSYATAEARCAAAPAGGGEVCHIINPIRRYVVDGRVTYRRYVVDGPTDPKGCNYNGIRAPPPPPWLQLSSLCFVTLKAALI